jgi:oligopeptide transport system permease protein
MIQYMLRKFLHVIIVLFGTTLITFLLMHAIPGNPWSNYSSSPRLVIGLGYDNALRSALNYHFGLDLPLWRQYTRYVIGDFNQDGSFFCGAICGNLGPSIQQRGRGVQNILFGASEGRPFWDSPVGYSIRLVLLGALITVGLGIPLGVLIATRPKSAISRSLSVGLAALISIPNFVLGLLAIIILASWLKIISVIPNWNYLSNWIMPAVVLAVMPMASIARVTRASLMDILTADYIRTAHAKGLTKTRVIFVHVMRNAFVPILTFLGPALMEMFVGLFIVENLYSFPGLGREFWVSILELDYPMILGLTVIYAAGILMINILIEIFCAILDPRLRSNVVRANL